MKRSFVSSENMSSQLQDIIINDVSLEELFDKVAVIGK